MKTRWVWLVGLFWLLAGCSPAAIQLPGVDDAATDSQPAAAELMPNPKLSPGDVVRIQIEALKNNDPTDTGIEITFRFASPANKQITGPLSRFKELVKNPEYRPMLNHKLAEFDSLRMAGDTATQRVTIIERNGQATVYLFSLSRQDLPDCPACWLTDSVLVIPTRKQGTNQI